MSVQEAVEVAFVVVVAFAVVVAVAVVVCFDLVGHHCHPGLLLMVSMALLQYLANSGYRLNPWALKISIILEM